ncbi:MAG: hypothetical protein JSV49_03025 [Thermoplasmata archaeon]|nr:MAG: hypothetical protein JSV49_03025 [Thermoplasmata archaeon]
MRDIGRRPIADNDDYIYLIGDSYSSDFPVTDNALDTTHNGNYDSFFVKLNKDKINYSIAMDLKLSRPAIYRTEQVLLFSNATDFNDTENLLTPVFEYRDPYDKQWNSTFISTPKYVNSRWQVSFTPPVSVPPGKYDFRVRYNNSELKFGSWAYLYNELTVHNYRPIIEDIKLSKYTAIRGDAIHIWVNGTDFEDLEQDLTLILHYRRPFSLLWNASYPFSPAYINDRWECVFDIPMDAPFGYYGFRAAFVDPELYWSRWIYINNSLHLVNCIPEVSEFSLSKNSINRTESVQLCLYASDHETEKSMLTYYVEYNTSNPSIDWRILNGKYANDTWESEFLTHKKSYIGPVDFRYKIDDSDGASTGWLYKNDSLMIQNNLPEISQDLDDIKINYSGERIDLTQFEFDIEDSGSDLTWSVSDGKYQYLKSVAIIDEFNDTLEIIPEWDSYGSVDIELTLTDSDGGLCKKTDITILVDTRIELYGPHVTLVSPYDNEEISTTTPTLGWALYYLGFDNITFDIYLEENAEPAELIKSNLNSTEYKLEFELEPGKKYYWKVLPNIGICLSDPFCFTVGIDINGANKVNLSAEKNYIGLKQGGSEEIELILKSECKSTDTFRIEYQSTMPHSIMELDGTEVKLGPGSLTKLRLSIDIPADFEPGTYSVTVKAASISNESVHDEVTIDIEVFKKEFVPRFDVSVKLSEDYIEMETGSSTSLILTITNIGNVYDEYTISYPTDASAVIGIMLNASSVQLEFGESIEVEIILSSYKPLLTGTFDFDFKVKSANSAANATLSVKLKLPESGSDSPPVTKSEGEKNNSTILIAITIIVLVTIVLVLLFLFVFRKRAEVEENQEKSAEDSNTLDKGIHKQEGFELPKNQDAPVLLPVPEEPEVSDQTE